MRTTINNKGAIEISFDSVDEFENALNPQRKSPIDLCETMTWEDCELGDLVVYFRVIDAPLSAQTDESGDSYTIECVKLNDEAIDIDSKMEEDMLRHLNETDPLKVHNPRKRNGLQLTTTGGDLDCDELRQEMLEALEEAEKALAHEYWMTGESASVIRAAIDKSPVIIKIRAAIQKAKVA